MAGGIRNLRHLPQRHEVEEIRTRALLRRAEGMPTAEGILMDEGILTAEGIRKAGIIRKAAVDNNRA